MIKGAWVYFGRLWKGLSIQTGCGERVSQGGFPRRNGT